ncbi:MAG: hypothetical protein GWP05_02040, partial [Anaerolineaceae bacterium]|nr:hypothetical protein [Anaerolineaceae bacterium]
MPKVFAAICFVLAATAALPTAAGAPADGGEGPAAGEANVALVRWGAEAWGEGQPFNPGYPVQRVIDGTPYPALFGSKPRGIVGGSVTIDLALDTDIAAVVL